MCHHYEFNSAEEYGHEETDDETAEEFTPEFEEAEDVEILTDGGDGDE